MRKKLNKPNTFRFKFKRNVVEVWLGPINDPESDFVLEIDRIYIPDLIATLRRAQDT